MTARDWQSELLEAFPGRALVLVDAEGRVERCNGAAERALGPRGRAAGGPDAFWAAMVGGADASRLIELREALAREGHWRGTLELRDLDGAELPFDVEMRRVAAGRLLVTARDARELRAREGAEQERAATEEYLARLGHELRTPLNAVLGFAQLLELEPLPSDQREAVEHVLTAGRFMASLLDDVLDLARVRGGGVDLDVGPVPVLDVVRGVLDLLAPLADRRGMRRWVEPAGRLVALADRTRLWQVVLNLVGNAVKYGREGGTLRVGVAPVAGGRVRIEVEDDGPGIAPESLDRLFRPFQRLGAERTGVEGTGLGLALAKALVSAMGGQLSAHSRLGSGTLMAVELDAVDAAAVAQAAEAGTPHRAVVHVSGDAASQALVAQALRTRLGAQTVSVGRAALAPDVVRRTQPALVLLDETLPDGSAGELLHRLAGNPLTALVPAVVFSQDAADARVALRLRAAGAAGIIGLPLDLRELLDVVGRFLDRAAAARHA